jgi:hypothetical protein
MRIAAPKVMGAHMRTYTQAPNREHDTALEAEHDQPQNQGGEPTPDKLDSSSCRANSYWHELEQEGFELAFPHVSHASSAPTIADLFEALRLDDEAGC